MKQVTLKNFYEFVKKVNPAISEADADLFLDKYHDWTEFRYFPDIMKERTGLPLAVIIDLDTAYQLLLGNLDVIQQSDAIECAEVNKYCRMSLALIGEENFVSSVHCSPQFIWDTFADEKTIEAKIAEAVEADKIGAYDVRVADI